MLCVQVGAVLALALAPAGPVASAPPRAAEAACGAVAAAEPGAAPERSPAPDPEASAEDLMQRAMEAYRQGRFDEAARAWLLASGRYEEAGAVAQEADARLGLAQAWTATGRMTRGLAELSRAESLARESGDPVRIASVMAAQGDAYAALGQEERASELFQSALDETGDAETPALAGAVHNSRGNLLSRRGEHRRAAEDYAKSAALARAAGREELAVGAEANAARALLEAGEIAGLDERLLAAAERARALPDSQPKARALIHLGRTYRLLGDREGVDPAVMVGAARLLDEAAVVAERIGDHRSDSFALGYRGEVYERDDRREEAVELTRRALFAAESAGAPEALYRWQWQLGRLYKAGGDDAEAIAAYREAVETLGGLRAGGSVTKGGQDFRSTVQPVYFGLVDLLLKRAAFADDAEKRQRDLREARNTVEELRTEELRDFFEDECIARQHETAPDSIPGTVVIYPIVLPERTELIVSLPSGLKSYTVPVSSQELESEVGEFREFLEKRTTRQYRTSAAQLYDWLIRPLEADLAGAPVETLVFIPDGVLRTIPMAALYDRRAKQFLIEKYPLAIAPGLTLTEPRPIDRENVELLVAGLTESVQGYPALPWVKSEVAVLESTFGGESLMDRGFVTPAVEKELAGHQIGIVHIASHGEFHGSGSESFLLTWDDRLPVDRLAELVGITQYRERPLELLTLSACQTAAGDERAALGLAGVAVRAGARSALATLWFINDAASAELISEFYRQLSDPGVSRARALQRAQLKLLESRPYRHPGYWSPFLLISNWL